ncbi:hypothetical protein DEFDS_1794 [Deferribacter desulfuricans SSM1]|uniref:Uncharacterized protein n=1 Tax=Deferribacter desulfuricans (strain DSM 14783 / JCM 11476 / NBRC 101012 / SSM1) TaxID=639282 RepID=D3P959_DEFDS|nr:hypothetical protein [Deferribacter desulfuricans]BAI81249.1 hypothetical protein DEFDS_1794 [Deferribacter desulfuricans SSM1]
MKKILFLLLSIFIFSLLSVECMALEINDYLDDLIKSKNAEIIYSYDNKIILDKGSKSEILPGQKCIIYHIGEKIINPITGEVLGETKKKIGEATIGFVNDNYSVAEINKLSSKLKSGDICKVVLPDKVNINFESDLKDNRKIINMLKDNRILIDNNSTFKIEVKKDNKYGKLITVYNNDEIVWQRYVTNVKLAKKEKNKITKIELGDKGYKFITYCKITKDKSYYILASNKYVDFFEFNNEDFNKKVSLGEKFNNIINLDCADVNGNGLDELFITTNDSGNGIKTFIYEYRDNKLELVKSNFPYITRMVLVNGRKYIFVQRLTRTGEFIGKIRKLNYRGDYIIDKSLDETDGYSIYGFGYGDVNNDKLEEIIRINKKSELEIYDINGNRIFKSSDNYGRSGFYFQMKRHVKEEVKNPKEDDERIAELKSRIYLNDRIFVDRKGRIWVGKVLSGLGAIQFFNESIDKAITVNKLNGDLLTELWTTNNLGSNISDYYIMRKDGFYYLYILEYHEPATFLSKADSKLYIYKLNLD